MLSSMQTQTHNLEKFQAAAAKFSAELTPLSNRATVVGLYGELGSGKTTFVQAVAKAFGVSERVTSPTFLILKSYKLTTNSYKLLVHVDVYRLRSSTELARLRFDELLSDPHNLILVEWADKVADLLPKDHFKLHFGFVDENTRKITID